MFSRPKKWAVLLEPLGLKTDATHHDDVLLCVMNDGSVFYYVIFKDFNNYLYVSPNKIPQSDATENFSLYQFIYPIDVVAYSRSEIKCVGCFTPISDQQKLHACYSPENQLLMIFGVLYENVPSFAIYKMRKDCMDLILVDSMIGNLDACFYPNINGVISLPRSMPGIVSVFHFPNELPRGLNHRYIPKLVFAGFKARRSSHIVSCRNSARFHFASWSDDPIPHISLWRVFNDQNPYLHWMEISFEFTIPALIQGLSFDNIGRCIGFILVTNDDTSICVWEYDKDQSNQVNIIMDPIQFGKIICTKWDCSTSGNSQSFYVLTTTSLFEHTGTSVLVWNNPNSAITNFITYENKIRFYVSTEGILRVMRPQLPNINIGEVSEITEKRPSLPYVKAISKGKCDTASGFHMHRCANCKKPLIHPLICRDKQIENCYCTLECQKEHWPVFAAVQTSVATDKIKRFIIPDSR